MLCKRTLFGKKNAEITMEITLSAALAIVAIILVLGLFGDNLQSIAVNSGIYNIFNRDKLTQEWGTTANKTQLGLNQTPQKTEETETLADQGLEEYISDAQETIEKYKTNPPTIEAQIQDLAKAATIAKICNVLSLNDESIFYTRYGIQITDRLTYDEHNNVEGYSTLITTSGKRLSFNIGSQILNENMLDAVKLVKERNFS